MFVFSTLPQVSFYDAMSEILKAPEKIDQNITIGNEDIFYLNEQQDRHRAFLNTPRDENGVRAVPVSELPQAKMHNCYVIQFDVESDCFNANSPKAFFDLFQKALLCLPHGMSPAEEQKISKENDISTLRLDDGTLHIKLYFDKDTKQCVKESVDATECAKPMIDFVANMGYAEPTDNSCVIERHYSTTDYKKLPAEIGLNEEININEVYKNKIVTPNWINEGTFNVAKVDKYQVRADLENYLYEIWDGNNMVATVIASSMDQMEMLKESGMEIESKDNVNLTMNKVQMKDVFENENKNNEDFGYAVMANVENDLGVLVICSWNEDVLRDVVDHMTFVSTNDPAAA